MEQELYREEGISIPGTAFVDNQPTLDLLELKSTGVFSMCDEELNVPRGSDEGFLTKVLQKHGDGKHPNMIRPKAKETADFQKCFGILHYAGNVFYNVSNFLEKNKDQLHPDIINVLRGSTSRMISAMFPVDTAEEAKGGKGGSKATKLTLGAQFKMQLKDLINTLNSTFPHFVRCMKSNDKKVDFRIGTLLAVT
jgi:myosin heavy subunit